MSKLQCWHKGMNRWLHPPKTWNGIHTIKILLKGLRSVVEFFCHNARGRVRNRKSDPEDVLFAWAWVHCDNRSQQIGLTHDYSMTILSRECWYSPIKRRIRSDSRFACYSHSYGTWCTLTTGVADSQCPWSRNAVLVTRYLKPFISVFYILVQLYLNKTGVQWICELNWQLWCCFWDQWMVASPVNGANDWHGEYGHIQSTYYGKIYVIFYPGPQSHVMIFNKP